MSGGDAARREEGDDDDEHGSKLVVVGKEERTKTAAEEEEEGENAHFPVKKRRKESGNAHSSGRLRTEQIKGFSFSFHRRTRWGF